MQSIHSFDEQAESFDGRAGLPEDICASIARAVWRLTQIHPTYLLLEVGPGTGQIGHELCRFPLRYVGFDSSRAMLNLFAERCRASGRPTSLVQADGHERWPVEAGSVKVFFSSRAIHLLPVEHAVAEIQRAASPAGASLVLGRIHRPKESVRARLRQEMRERLRSLGYPAREGQQRERKILEECCARGATLPESTVAAAWTVRSSATKILQSWREKAGLAGFNVPVQVKAAVLAHLETWAVENFGSLMENHEAQEKYVLEHVRLSAK